MKLPIKNLIYSAIINNKWLKVKYKNVDKITTCYYLGVKDIDINKGILFCDIFNPYKKNFLLKFGRRNIFIYIDNIIDAEIIEQSFYDENEELIKKINTNKEYFDFFNLIEFDNNILAYLSDCYKYDNDPFIRDYITLDDVDVSRLIEEKEYILDNIQFSLLLEKVFKNNKAKTENILRYKILAINDFSIDINNKPYVVSYRVLNLNFKTRKLRLSPNIYINKSFLVEMEKKVTLNKYLNISVNDFCSSFLKNRREYIDMMQSNFNDGEIINTKPFIFLLERDCLKGVDETFSFIANQDKENKLSFPLKSFFGRNKSRNKNSLENNIVVFDRDKINIDQLRVVYNAMNNHVTYVKGPPGTGKTETIFNTILSAYSNDKTVLICSNNNHPVNDIFKKFERSFCFKNNEDEEDIIFPILRVGNNIEMVSALDKIKAVYKYAKIYEDINVKDFLINKNKSNSLSNFIFLKEKLEKYEKLIELQEENNALNKIQSLCEIGKINSKLNDRLKLNEDKIHALKKEVEVEDVLSLVISAKENQDFQNYIKLSAINNYKKLLSKSFSSLKEIIDTVDINDAVNKFNKYLRNEGNLRKLLNVFPIILCTNLSCDKLGEAKPIFDIVIMDEAGQCNIATSLIPISRGNSLLLVGDTNQLQPVTLIEENVNDDLLNFYKVDDDYNYINNSILSLMLKKDTNSKCILLSYHYRCGKRIANFVNQRFYENNLKLLNENSGDLIYCNVCNTPLLKRNSYLEEAKAIANIIKSNKYEDVGIITPFVNQAKLINEYLLNENISNVKAGTVHTLQGSEKSTIILSSCLSYKTARKTMDWIKNNHELINVAVTRAKDRLIFVGDKIAIDKLCKSESSDIKYLSDYVYKNGEMIVPKSNSAISFDFSNNSIHEKEFFETIKPYFNRRNNKFKIERNVPIKKAIKNVAIDELNIFGKKEFDVVVQVKTGIFSLNYITIIVFEIDGGEHIGSKLTSKLDREKEKICQNFGIKLIRIPNSMIKDYETIINLFEMTLNNVKLEEQNYSQISLFDD